MLRDKLFALQVMRQRDEMMISPSPGTPEDVLQWVHAIQTLQQPDSHGLKAVRTFQQALGHHGLTVAPATALVLLRRVTTDRGGRQGAVGRVVQA